MQRSIMLLALCAAAACSASPRSRVSEGAVPSAPPVEPVHTGQADVDLTGLWQTGSGDEPTAKEFVLHPGCNYTPSAWVIQQSGDTVRAWTMPESRAQGIARRHEPGPPPAEGLVSGVDLTLGTPDEHYVLHYDSTTGHLRGTLNGAPLWAVRVEIERPERCIPVP